MDRATLAVALSILTMFVKLEQMPCQYHDWRRHVWLYGSRQEYPENGALPQRAFHLDVPLVRLDYLFDDSKPQPHTPCLRVTRFVDSIETVKDIRQIVSRYANTGVDNFNQRTIDKPLRAQRNGATSRRMGDGVVH